MSVIVIVRLYWSLRLLSPSTIDSLNARSFFALGTTTPTLRPAVAGEPCGAALAGVETLAGVPVGLVVVCVAEPPLHAAVATIMPTLRIEMRRVALPMFASVITVCAVPSVAD